MSKTCLAFLLLWVQPHPFIDSLVSVHPGLRTNRHLTPSTEIHSASFPSAEHMHTGAQICTHNIHVNTVHRPAHLYIHTRTGTQQIMHTGTYTSTHTHMLAQVSRHTCACMLIHTCSHTCAAAHTHTLPDWSE